MAGKHEKDFNDPSIMAFNQTQRENLSSYKRGFHYFMLLLDKIKEHLFTTYETKLSLTKKK